MKSEFGSYEAKTHLPKLLVRVANGETITIMRHGAPVAKLVPVSAERHQTPLAVAEELRLFRKGRRLNGLSLRTLIDTGRR